MLLLRLRLRLFPLLLHPLQPPLHPLQQPPLQQQLLLHKNTIQHNMLPQ